MTRSAGSSGPVTGAQVRSALLGTPVEGVHVVRQAWRLTEDDSDELVLMDARGIWWVARRVSDQVAVWVYVGDAEAEVGFERLLDAARHSDHAWRESTNELLEQKPAH